jgi:hypothetical protein
MDAPLPHLDGAVLEARLLVEDGQVLEGREVLRVQLDGLLELGDAVEDEALLAEQESQVKVEPVGQRVDVRACLEQLDRAVDLPRLVSGDAVVQRLLGLRR